MFYYNGYEDCITNSRDSFYCQYPETLESLEDFNNWAGSDALTCYFEGIVYLKVKVNNDDDYEVLTLTQANNL